MMIGFHPSGIDRKKDITFQNGYSKTKLFGYWLTLSNSLHKIQKDVKQVVTF